MIEDTLLNEQFEDYVLKEQMILEAVLILAEVEWLKDRLEQKLLELDSIDGDNISGSFNKIKGEITSLLAALKREEIRMDEFMFKYRKIINEKKALLHRPGSKKSVQLRGVSAKQRRTAKGS